MYVNENCSFAPNDIDTAVTAEANAFNPVNLMFTENDMLEIELQHQNQLSFNNWQYQHQHQIQNDQSTHHDQLLNLFHHFPTSPSLSPSPSLFHYSHLNLPPHPPIFHYSHLPSFSALSGGPVFGVGVGEGEGEGEVVFGAMEGGLGEFEYGVGEFGRERGQRSNGRATKHFASERHRRDQMRDTYEILKKLVPNPTKVNTT